MSRPAAPARTWSSKSPAPHAGAEMMTKLPRTRGRIVVVAIFARAAEGGSVPLLLARTEAMPARASTSPRISSRPSHWPPPERCRSTELDHRRACRWTAWQTPCTSMEGGGDVHEDSRAVRGGLILHVSSINSNWMARPPSSPAPAAASVRRWRMALAEAGADIVGVSASLEAEGSAVEREVTARGRKFSRLRLRLRRPQGAVRFHRTGEARRARHRHSGQQRRHDSAQARRRASRRILGPDHREWISARSSCSAARSASEMVERGSGKIIFTASLLTFPGRHHSARLRGGQGRHRPAHQGAGQRMGGRGRAGECHRARLHRHGQHRRRCAPIRCAIPRFSRAFRPAAGERRRTSPAPWCSWRRRHRTTSAARS